MFANLMEGGTMSALRFGMIQAADIQPGFAFKNPKNARNIYMVTERVDKPVHHPPLSKQTTGWTPVVFNASGENPAYDPVTIERKRGDKLWINA
jgi:hypothetical protein